MSAAFVELRDVGLPVRTACALIGRARATHYRHVRGPFLGPKPARAPASNGQALSVTERLAVLELINTPTYADHSIGQIYARELDEDRYWCSVSSMYRIARAAGQTRERRRQATHPAKVKPQLLADGPSQVWTWDITKLRGPSSPPPIYNFMPGKEPILTRGQYDYHLATDDELYEGYDDPLFPPNDRRDAQSSKSKSTEGKGDE